MQRGKFSIRRAILLAAAFCICAVAGRAQTAFRTVLTGHLPAGAAEATAVGELAGSNLMDLSINLPLRHEDQLEELLGQVYDPASPRYHHYLSQDEFVSRFGPTEADYAAVLAWAGRQGMAVTGQHADRLLVELRAPVAAVERAFQMTLRTYARAGETRVYFAPDREPSVEAGVPMIYVGGLDNFTRPHPQNLRKAPLTTFGRQPFDLGSGPNGNLAGNDFRAAYVPGVGLDGTGQTIGLVEFDGYYSDDITSYESITGVPAVPVDVQLLGGFDGEPGDGNSEVALDIEMAISMAPGLSQVVVYEDAEVGFPSKLFEAMSGSTGIKQFSCSWDLGPLTPSMISSMNVYLERFAVLGLTYCTSSGDFGATNASKMPSCAHPYATSVGGTTLATVGPGGAWMGETAWNAGYGPGLAGTGGGADVDAVIPGYQKAVKWSSNSGSSVYRNYPDVAMAADNIFIVADDGEEESTGGTSCASPLWAGFVALMNQQAAAQGASSLGFMNPALYHIATNADYAAYFDDVTEGNNTNFAPTHYSAVPGYDLCTGWGSTAGGSLILALTATNSLAIKPARGPVGTGGAGGPFSATNQIFTLTNTSKAALGWTLTCTSAWLSFSATNGTLSAGASAPVAATLNYAAGILPAGVYTADLWFTNAACGQGQLRQFTLRVSQNLVLDGGFEAGDFCYWTATGAPGFHTNVSTDFSYDEEGLDIAAQSGEYFAALGEIGSMSFLSQTLTTEPGQYYTISFWLANPRAGTPNKFQLQWNSARATNLVYARTNMGVFGWTNLQFVVKAVTNQTILRFGARDDIGFICLDSVSVVSSPGPFLSAAAVGQTKNFPAVRTLAPQKVIQLSWTAQPGLTYQVQQSPSLASPNWANVSGPATAKTNSLTLMVTNPPAAQEYYRVELVPDN